MKGFGNSNSVRKYPLDSASETGYRFHRSLKPHSASSRHLMETIPGDTLVRFNPCFPGINIWLPRHADAPSTLSTYTRLKRVPTSVTPPRIDFQCGEFTRQCIPFRIFDFPREEHAGRRPSSGAEVRWQANRPLVANRLRNFFTRQVGQREQSGRNLNTGIVDRLKFRSVVLVKSYVRPCLRRHRREIERRHR